MHAVRAALHRDVRPVVDDEGHLAVLADGGQALGGFQQGLVVQPLETHLHARHVRSEEHTSELQSLMRISYAVFCFKKKNQRTNLSDLLYKIYPSNKSSE